MTQPAKFILLDACCLLNLYAAGRLRDIALALPHRLAVADYVLRQEALYVWRPGSGEMHEAPEPVDVDFLVAEGLIQVLRLENEEEEAAFVDLAALLDDGEAMTGALALHRGFAVATDDRKARRVLAELAPAVTLVSTLELLKQWAERSSPAPGDLRAAMLAMQASASYVPAESDSIYEWWRMIVRGKAGR